MKLRIDDISAETKTVAFSEPQAEVNRLLEHGPIREYVVRDPLEVDLSYYRSGMDLMFEGRVYAPVTAICARCIEEFDTPARRDFRFVLSPKVAGDLAEADLRAEDLEFSHYDGDEVDLAPLMREQLLLALPTRPVCADECRGLCSRCGANLNRGSCECGPEAPDPRLAPLRLLKVRRS